MATQTYQSTPTLSIVINTKNSAATLKACLQSVKQIADEIIIMDMHSQDDTVHIAKHFQAKVFTHPDVGYVEPARNAALSHATSDWVLIIDADEMIPPNLAKHIRDVLIVNPTADAYFLPRKNIIFGKWVKTGWWPDHVLRLFKKNFVRWTNEIHSVPSISGTVERLPENESLAIAHEAYQSIDQYIDRAQRYAKIVATGNSFQSDTTKDPLQEFFSEFLRRYFVWNGNEDKAHGYYLSLLQGVTRILESSYDWENKNFDNKNRLPQKKISEILGDFQKEARYWERTEKIQHSSGIVKIFWKIIRKMNL